MLMHDKYYMNLALEQAKIAALKDEVPVGAVLVDEFGKIIVKTHNLIKTLNDSTAHAEMLAIREGEKFFGTKLKGTSLFVNMEPCPMCAGAMVLARISRLIYAMPSPYGGAESLFNITNNSSLNHQIDITAGCLEEYAKLLIKKFFVEKR